MKSFNSDEPNKVEEVLKKKVLSNLTEDNKRLIVELLRKKEAVAQEQKLEKFTPNPGFQTNFLASKAKVRAAFTGSGAGKSTGLIIDLLWHHLGIHPHRSCDNIHHTWLVVQSHEKAEDYWNELKRWCPPSQLPSVDKMGSSHIRRFRWKNGSLTTIFSHEQDFSKLEGTNISAVYFDEAPPRALWISAFRGLRSNPDYFAVITTTPYAEAWLFEEVYQPWLRGEAPHIEVFRGSTYENQHISREWIDDYARMMSEEERAVRIDGGFATVAGRVFGEFTRERHLLNPQEWPEDWPVWVCIDPHVRKAHTAVWLGVTPEGNFVVLDEVYVKGTIADLATQLKEVNKKYPGLESIYIDTKGVESDWTRSSAVDILFQNGVKCTSVRKTDKDIMSGISRIKQLLRGDPETGEPFLKIMDHCRNTITEFEMYSWAENRHPEKTGVSERPRKTHDDFIDPLRYLIAKNLVGSVEYKNEQDEPVSLFQHTSYVKKDKLSY